jgi:hypothetical protein
VAVMEPHLLPRRDSRTQRLARSTRPLILASH